MPTRVFDRPTRGIVLAVAGLGMVLSVSPRAGAQQVTITAPLTLNASATTIGTPPVPLATAQIVVQGTTLTIDRTAPLSIASLELRVGGGVGAVLTHTPGTRIDITTTGNLLVDANSVISADSKGLTGSQGMGAGQSANGYNGGGAAYGGAGADSALSSQAVTTLSGLGGLCYGFDQASLFGPTALGSGGGGAWVNGAQDLTSGGVGGGAIAFHVGGTLTLNGSITANGGGGGYRNGSNRSGGGGSGGSIFISASAIAGTGSIFATGGNGITGDFNNSSGGGGGGRVAIITNSTSLDELATPVVTGGTGWVRGGAGTFYQRLGGETRGTLFIDGSNASVGEATEFYGPVTLDANVVVKNNGRLGATQRLTDTDPNTFDLTILGNLNVTGGTTAGAITAAGRGRRGDSGAGAGRSQELVNGGGGGFGGRGGDGNLFPTSGGPVYGDMYSLVLGSGGGSAWVSGSQDRTSGGFGGGTLKLDVRGTLTLSGVIAANGGGGNYRNGSNRSGGGGSGGSIFIAANAITGNGSILATGGNGIVGDANNSSGGGGGGRVVVVTCTPSTPSVNVAGGTGGAAGQAGTSVVRAPGFIQQPTPQSFCVGTSATFQVVYVGLGQPAYLWRKAGTPINTTANPSAATATLTLSNVQAADVAAYDCLVTDACGSVASAPAALSICRADFNCSGGLSAQDIFDFLNAWFAGSLTADFNGGGLSVQDIFDFLNAWFVGC